LNGRKGVKDCDCLALRPTRVPWKDEIQAVEKFFLEKLKI